MLFALCMVVHAEGTPPKGYELFTIKSEATGNARLKIVVVDQRVLRAGVHGLTPKRQNGMTPMEVVLDSKAIIALGSGFVSSFSPLMPSGFLKIEGRVISNLKREGYNGVLGVDKNGYIKLLPHDAIDLIGGLREGFQTGPTLVTGGEARKLNKNEFTRSFCGLTRDNRVVIGISLDRVDLNVLARFLVNPPDGYKQLKCVTALNLAGGGSEALVVEKKLVQEGNYDLKCASILGFARR